MSRRRAHVAALAGVAALVLAACDAPMPMPRHAARLSNAAVVIGTTSYASIAMGHLDDPANTFWEVLVQDGSSRWRLVTPPGIATNGGITVAAATPDDVIAAVLPSQLLKFTGLAQSSDGGANWSSGIVVHGLARAPDAIAAGASGRSVALVSGRAGTVLSAPTPLSGWSPLVTRASLVASTGVCRLTAVTSVAIGAGAVLVGGRCTSGTVPIAEHSGSTWREVGPALGGRADVDVLRLVGTTSGAVGIVLERRGSRSWLLALASTNRFSSWQVSPLAIGTATVLASAIASNGAAAVLVRARTGALEAFATSGPVARWSGLPAPPGGTGLVTTSNAAVVEALIVHASLLTVDELHAGRWTPVQQLVVPILYGSSS